MRISDWSSDVCSSDLWLLANGYKADLKLADMQDKQLRALGASLNRWEIVPNGSEGYRKAEVTLGGVDTRELSQQTMMVHKVQGQIGRASCRERGCQYVKILVVAVTFKKKIKNK